MALSHNVTLGPESSVGSQQKPVREEDGDDALAQLQTERCNPQVADLLDRLDTADLCAAFLAQEAQVVPAIAACLPQISALVDALVTRLQHDPRSRLIYVGAGNSGRVALMDCSELPVTFSVDPARFRVLVAGGRDAMFSSSRENAEDSETDGAAALQSLCPTPADTVIGIAASGRTPFVLGALRAAQHTGALTAGITSCHPTVFSSLGLSYSVVLNTGPEFVAGSTRLKAGTAAKEVLNMLSTCTMVRLGKTYYSLMLDVHVHNHKLRMRARSIFRQVCKQQGGQGVYLILHEGAKGERTDLVALASTNLDASIDTHIQLCGGSVKLACAVALSGLDISSAQSRLHHVSGSLYIFLQQNNLTALTSVLPLNGLDDRLVLAIDGGGTHCRVSIATIGQDSVVARGEAGPCNVLCTTADDVGEQIRLAVVVALDKLYGPRKARTQSGRRHSLPPRLPRFSRVWAGLAGLQYATRDVNDSVRRRLQTLLSVSTTDGSLCMTNDGLLLGACLATHSTAKRAIAVVAGTGSVATAFRKTESPACCPPVETIGRTGGWGYLLGDSGSAYDLGRRAVQAVITNMEQQQDDQEDRCCCSSYQDKNPPPAQTDTHRLEEAILRQLGTSDRRQMLTNILHNNQDLQAHARIAGLSRVVTKLAFPGREEEEESLQSSNTNTPDPVCLEILQAATADLVGRVKPLVKPKLCNPSTSILILSGALLNFLPYRELFLDAWAEAGLPAFMNIVVVEQVADRAAGLLVEQERNRP
ncbi:hypothetical protein DV738_g616, partial [Chaetothyriales sp. CBS 135597]